jgi:hypothetical protein
MLSLSLYSPLVSNCRFSRSLKAYKNATSTPKRRVNVLSQTIIVKTIPILTRLSLNIPNVNGLFPGFAAGDFAVLHGVYSVVPLSLLLCVRSQLPIQLGGLETNVIFVDGGNTFRLYHISRLAQLHQLNPREVLDRIFISRAFTAHQMVMLVMDKLNEIANGFNAKLAIISDVEGLFLDEDINDEEAKRVFSHVIAYLSKFAVENQLVIVTTCPPHHSSPRNIHLHAIVCGKANTIINLRHTKQGPEFVLEKHPQLCLGYAKLPLHTTSISLTEFMRD